MKRNAIALLLVATVMAGILLTGCGHTHVWKAATCTEPKTCVNCGQTEGEVSGHSFAAATCTTPKTCEVCGTTEGEALSHQWVEASFDAPKTCQLCGETEGGMYVFEEATDLNELAEKYDGHCLAYKDELLVESFNNYNGIDFKHVDINDNEVASVSYDSLGYGITSYYFYTNGIEDALITMYIDWSGYESDDIYLIIVVMDVNGNKLAEKKIPVNEFYGVLDKLSIQYYKDIVLVQNSDSKKVLMEFDYTKNELVEDATDLSIVEKFDYWEYRSCCDYYQVSVVENDLKKWGFADAEGNILKLYDDATHFNESGYALVTENGQVNLIDTDFNVVKENACEIGTLFAYGNFFGVNRDGAYTYYKVGMSDPIEKSESTDVDQSASGITSASNVAVDGVLDLSLLEVTPNDTQTMEQVAESWAVYDSGTVLMTSGPQKDFWIECRQYEEKVDAHMEAPLLAFGKISGEAILGDFSNISNLSIYDESFDVSSVKSWKVGLTRDDSVEIIAYK